MGEKKKEKKRETMRRSKELVRGRINVFAYRANYYWHDRRSINESFDIVLRRV